MSLIFFVTSLLAKIHNTRVILKENQKKVIFNTPNQQVIKKELKNYTDKINYIIDICNTLGEALAYIEQNYKNDTNLQVKTVLKDSIVGVTTISSALETMYSDLDNKNIKVETSNLEFLLNELMHSLNENNIERAENIINFKLSNEYNHWESDIENEFR
ncbi:hypothetical protein [Clostridium tagluense]|uniref:hypothetical protein n=1 Tax=Clostridium tagluense TaxID=360422 RepID=UPI001CF1D28A|nr:hypothetical protein [Clostridium tagluense]MCB2297175.1 hypothetical protein [Clostridium tagluense]